MNRIIPGCMVMIVGHPVASNNGKSATAIRYVGDAATDSSGMRGALDDYWEIDRSVLAHFINPKTGKRFSNMPVMVRYCSEQFLMRIDGYTGVQEQEKEELEK